MSQFWLIKVLFVILVQANLSRCMNQCCQGSAEWIGEKNCSDGTRISIVCPHGMYHLNPVKDPEYDNFTLVEEELSLVGSTNLIETHRFCIGLNPDNTTMALVCFDEPAPPAPPEWRSIVLGSLCVVSTFFLLITLIVYAILPELHDLQGKILICAMTALFAAYVTLAMMQLNPNSALHHQDELCKTIAFVMYYCFMSAFFWINLVAFNVWRTAWFKRSPIQENTWFWIFSAIGWGVPGIFLMIALVGHHTEGIFLDPGFGRMSCWFADNWEPWAYFYIPVGCLMTLNVIYFALTCYELWHKYRNLSGSRLKVLRFKCLLYLKLVWVTGITWIFEFISFATGNGSTHYWLLTDALNSLQGFIIFILLVATRKRVGKLLATKKPCGLSFPKQWAAGEDEECEIVLSEEEVELSQSA